jgi:hypothetical protein
MQFHWGNYVLFHVRGHPAYTQFLAEGQEKNVYGLVQNTAQIKSHSRVLVLVVDQCYNLGLVLDQCYNLHGACTTHQPVLAQDKDQGCASHKSMLVLAAC